jgi:hypothetical protein
MRITSLSIGLLLTSLLSVVQAAEPTSLFNGKDLTGWRGRSDLWNVQDGAITGRTTEENPIQENTFLVSEAEVKNFDLTFEYRIEHGNSGVQYRSQVIDEAKFVVGGYQADIDSQSRYSGINYEERGRGIIADRGQVTLLAADKPEVLGLCGDATKLQEVIHDEDWNTYRIVAIDGHLRHFINGTLMSEVIDVSEQGKKSGVLALQLHRGPAMVVQFRNFKLTEM